MSYYNYKIGDIKLNLFLKDIYKHKYIDFIKKHDYDECTIDLNKYIREFELLKPQNVKEDDNHYCLYFNLHYKIEKKILLFIYEQINNQIKKIYDSFHLKDYMY
jgi:hypothetical protein